MYLGHAVENANPRTALTREPRHPYTGALLSAGAGFPRRSSGRERRQLRTRGRTLTESDQPAVGLLVPSRAARRFHPGHCDAEEPGLIPFGHGHAASVLLTPRSSAGPMTPERDQAHSHGGLSAGLERSRASRGGHADIPDGCWPGIAAATNSPYRFALGCCARRRGIKSLDHSFRVLRDRVHSCSSAGFLHPAVQPLDRPGLKGRGARWGCFGGAPGCGGATPRGSAS